MKLYDVTFTYSVFGAKEHTRTLQVAARCAAEARDCSDGQIAAYILNLTGTSPAFSIKSVVPSQDM